jgi:hypothetical protein
MRSERHPLQVFVIAGRLAQNEDVVGDSALEVNHRMPVEPDALTVAHTARLVLVVEQAARYGDSAKSTGCAVFEFHSTPPT